MNDIKPCIVVSLFLVLFFFVGCDENPMTPESGTISGVVDFSGVWPETGNISISLNTSWPEVTGAPYAFTTIYSNDLNQDNLYSYRFENVTFGTYQGIIVSWKDPYDDNSATNQHAIGGYGGTAEAEFEDTGSITVSESDYEITDLNFPAYLDLIDETIPAESGTISGVITFSGTWPISGTVSISLNTDWPPTVAPYAFIPISSNELNSDNQYSYIFEDVAFGTYAALAVSWEDPEDDNPATNQHTFGAYGGTYPFFVEYGGINPTAITISVSDYLMTDLNFDANLDY